ncbi:MAG: TSUP family transporter, partial [Candidatus Rokubacteria bacterium]|nr:TSUP family transporter [Candidatus Rokubacteria bacterium]
MMEFISLLAIGLVAGVLGGMFGIGGGLVIVPALIFLLKMKQFDALGTSLAALIPPVGLLGAFEYYRNGHMNLKFAALIALG